MRNCFGPAYELDRGHPTLFSQSQDKLRTKELEFVHQLLNLPFIVIGPLMKEVQFFCSELVL